MTRNVSLFKRIPDTITSGSADIDHAVDIDHAKEQSEPIPVHVPHHACAHQPRVDAPTVTPVPIVQSSQLTSVPNNDGGVVTTSRGRIIRKPSYFNDVGYRGNVSRELEGSLPDESSLSANV